VLIVIYTDGGEFLLLERRRPAGFWQSVTGSLEWGEMPTRAARRELIEETGITQGVLASICSGRRCTRFALVRQEIRARHHAQSRARLCAEIAQRVPVTLSDSNMCSIAGARPTRPSTAVVPTPIAPSDLNANARALGRFLAATPADTLHLVGHSLGGLVILDFFESFCRRADCCRTARPLPPGRIVLLGSPVRGSRSAQRLAQLPFGKSHDGNVRGCAARRRRASVTGRAGAT
jgi:ADP-ribose pyrophosphatase YjhB (NUDIX family)